MADMPAGKNGRSCLDENAEDEAAVGHDDLSGPGCTEARKGILLPDAVSFSTDSRMDPSGVICS